MTGKIYVYKLTVDSGGAPCVERGVLSLAICKPMIRRTAEVGDLIFGFAASSLSRDNRLIYVARVTDTKRNGAYFRDKRFARRGDCVYEWHRGRFHWRRGARYPMLRIARRGVPIPGDCRHFPGDRRGPGPVPAPLGVGSLRPADLA
jgi:hypothetical protein